MIFFEKQGLASETLSCAKKNWSIYTTNQPYSWCQKNANTFLFATQFLNGESDILAAFCYNMEHLSLETFVYNTTDLHHYNINQVSIFYILLQRFLIRSSNSFFINIMHSPRPKNIHKKIT